MRTQPDTSDEIFEPVPAMAPQVLECFVRNPQVVDSLEGIARFRIQQQTIKQTVEQVELALDWLVQQGFVLEEQTIGVSPMFRLNRERASEAEHFVFYSSAPGAEAAARHRVSSPGPRAAERRSALVQSEVMKRALAWIDAILLRHHLQHPAGEDDLPGLTRSVSSITSALATEKAAHAASHDAEKGVEDATRQLALAFERAEPSDALRKVYYELSLTFLELQALVLCLAPELDAKYQTIYGVLNDDLGRRAATLGLVCALLGEPLVVRNELARAGALIKWKLLEGGAPLPYADEPLRLDAAIVDWLLGDDTALLADPCLARLVRGPSATRPAPRGPGRSDESRQRLHELLTEQVDNGGWLVLSGADALVWRSWLEASAETTGQATLTVAMSKLAELDESERSQVGARLMRATQLLSLSPVLEFGGISAEGSSWEACGQILSAFLADDRGGIGIVDDPTTLLSVLPAERTRVLQREPVELDELIFQYAAATSSAGFTLDEEDVAWLASTFPLSPDAIDRAVRLAALEAEVRAPKTSALGLVAAACRRIAAPTLPRFARRLEPVFSLSDVVLPDDRAAQLAELVAHVRCATLVLNRWGFQAQLPYGRGVTALFFGPSGTGKSMAAQAIACELGTDVYVVDLSRIVSKYLGESEKHLDEVFGDAERAGAVLLFDEADALFGKRSDIKDAHDRYANIEVAYLLQRMEAFSGLAILTTNLRQNMDQAFLRRLRFLVEFPKPDASAREKLWRRCLPSEAPLAPDLNFKALARRLELTGGNIRQITLRAAFAAAREQTPTIEMRHIEAAALAELRKLGMPIAERELAEFTALRRQESSCAV